MTPLLKWAIARKMRYGMTKRDIAKTYGIVLKGKDTGTLTPWQQENAEKLEHRAKLWAQGMSTKQMAHECGMTERSMCRYIDCHRSAFPRRKKQCGCTDEELRRAREMRAEGMSFLAIANELDRPVSTVRSWITKEER